MCREWLSTVPVLIHGKPYWVLITKIWILFIVIEKNVWIMIWRCSETYKKFYDQNCNSKSIFDRISVENFKISYQKTLSQTDISSRASTTKLSYFVVNFKNEKYLFNQSSLLTYIEYSMFFVMYIYLIIFLLIIHSDSKA